MRRPRFIAEQARHASGWLGRLIAFIMARETWAENQRAIEALDVRASDHVIDIGSGHGRSGAHEYIGFARGAGAFASARNEIDRESFTDTDIVIEGRMCGVHERDFMGFAPSGRKVELPFVAFYQFDITGKLAHERVVMNLGPLRATN